MRGVIGLDGKFLPANFLLQTHKTNVDFFTNQKFIAFVCYISVHIFIAAEKLLALYVLVMWNRIELIAKFSISYEKKDYQEFVSPKL